MNIVLAVVLSRFMGVAGIALGTGLVGWLQFALMARSIKGKAAGRLDERSKRSLPYIFLASAIMAVMLFGLNLLLAPYLASEHTLIKVTALGGLVGIGGGCYFALIFGLGVLRFADIKQFLTRRAKDVPRGPEV
jgi:putative peptidoglycan lipid II flippase